jgi:hypothetical protein
MTEEKQTEILKRFIDGLTKSSGAAAQMVHSHQDPRFLPIKEKLIAVRDKAINMAIKGSGIKVENVSRH